MRHHIYIPRILNALNNIRKNDISKYKSLCSKLNKKTNEYVMKKSQHSTLLRK